MRNKLSLRHIVLSGLALLISSSVGYCRKQDITVTPESQVTARETEFSVVVNYATSRPSDEKTTGLGLCMYFDSSKLQFDRASNLLPDDFLQISDPESDTNDSDEDSDTDSFVLFAWANIDGNWVSSGALFRAEFTSKANFSGETSLNFVAISNAVFWTPELETGSRFNTLTKVVQIVEGQPPEGENQAPTFVDSPSEFFIFEAEPERTLGAIVATDPDGNNLIYSIAGGNSNDGIAINPST